MADTYTSHLELTKPELIGSIDTWGTKWNANLSRLDTLLAELIASVRGTNVPGVTKAFARQTAPEGWLECDGRTLNRADYPGLFEAIGTKFGAVNGSTFNLPDFRGEFFRGVTSFDGAGDHQDSGIPEHTHNASTSESGGHYHSGTAESAGYHGHGASVGAVGNHDHTGWTSTTGRHTHHMYLSGDAGNGGTTTGNGPDWQRTVYTSYAGQHTHSVDYYHAGNHNHSLSVYGNGNHAHSLTTSSVGNHTHTATIGSVGGGEFRPENVALLICIKT